jgi:hypothetical protein
MVVKLLLRGQWGRGVAGAFQFQKQGTFKFTSDFFKCDLITLLCQKWVTLAKSTLSKT